jgi:hypothetical protein
MYAALAEGKVSLIVVIADGQLVIIVIRKLYANLWRSIPSATPLWLTYITLVCLLYRRH